jgi:hypothetical protein
MREAAVLVCARAALTCAGCAVLSGGCEKAQRSAADASPAQGTPAASAAAALADASRPRAPHWGEGVSAAAHLPCRAVAVDGDVRAEDVAQPGSAHGRGGAEGGTGLALQVQQEVPFDSWLGLGASSRLVAKDPRTTRETTFRGPGRARPCVGRREESWMAAGMFESVVGAGEAPGSEEWLVTPLAVVRYAAASVRVAVGPKVTSVAVASGLAFAWLTDDARARWPEDAGAGDGGGHHGGTPNTDGWERVADGAVTIEALVSTPALQPARTAVEQCGTLAARAHELATLLMAPSVGLPDASTAAEEVVSRRLARAACAVAALRVGNLPEAPAKDALAAKLKDAEDTWTALPSP